MKAEDTFYVVQRTLDGKFIGCVSGLGRNRNKLDASHTKATAERHARRLRKEDHDHQYVVEGMVMTEKEWSTHWSNPKNRNED